MLNFPKISKATQQKTKNVADASTLRLRSISIVSSTRGPKSGRATDATYSAPRSAQLLTGIDDDSEEAERTGGDDVSNSIS